MKKKLYVELDFGFLRSDMATNSSSLYEQINAKLSADLLASRSTADLHRKNSEDVGYSDQASNSIPDTLMLKPSFCHSSSRRATLFSLSSSPTSPKEPPNATTCVRSFLFLRVAEIARLICGTRCTGSHNYYRTRICARAASGATPRRRSRTASRPGIRRKSELARSDVARYGRTRLITSFHSLCNSSPTHTRKTSRH